MGTHVDLPRRVHSDRINGLKRPLDLNTGVAMKDVNPSEAGERPLDQPLQGGTVADIGRHCHCATPGLDDGVRRPFAGVRVAVGRDDRCAFPRQHPGAGRADARSGASDDRYPPLEDHVVPHFILCHRGGPASQLCLVPLPL